MSSFADVAPYLLKAWSASPRAPTWGNYEVFSAPRAGIKRRKLALPNPVHHLLLCDEVAKHWAEIEAHTMGSSAISTYISTVFRRADRAIIEFDFNAFADAKSEILANYGRALNTDIQRFYGSLYTHAIPWALHTKAVAKANIKNLKKPGGPLLGDRLDLLVRNGQSGQTIGVPVGPDTSRIIAEIVAVAIDQKIEAQFGPLAGRYHRNVDDIFLGLR